MFHRIVRIDRPLPPGTFWSPRQRGASAPRIGQRLRWLPAMMVTVLIANCSLLPAIAADAPPAAPVKPVTDTYHGVEIVDPYRWMEDLKAPETQAWIKAQAEHADRTLQALPGRQAIFDRLQAPVAVDTVLRNSQRRGERWFYLRRAPGQDDFVLVMRDRHDAPERVLVDPATVFKDGKRWSINGFDASPDGRRVAYLVSEGGKEDPDTRVYDVVAGRDTGLRIARTWGADWLPDGSGFFSLRLPRLAAGAAATEGRVNLRTHLHRLGAQDPEADRALLGAGIDPGVPMTPIDYAEITAPPGTDLLIARVTQGTDNHAAFYVAPLSSVAEAKIPWRRLVGQDDWVAGIAIRGDDLYLLTAKDAPRYRILRTSLVTPDLAKAQTVVAQGEGVLKALVAARDALYVQRMDGGLSQLSRVDYEDGKATAITIPEGTSASLHGASIQTRDDGAFYTLAAFTDPPTWWRYDPQRRTSVDLKLAPPPAVDRSHIQATTAKARSHDGVEVPLVILHRRGIALDGGHPTVLYGYGAYGRVLLDPAGWPEYALSLFDRWIDNGFVMAIAGVRGGGEYGEQWHAAGKQATKPNTWKDFIAAAEYLVGKGYTRPQHLAGISPSAGGILLGNAIAERPDLFGAAVIQVGWTNALRIEATTNGAGNIPEFGSVATRAGFEALRAMDAYHNFRDGTDYPAVLLTHGINDPRVEPWFSAKAAARLQAANTSGKPVLLRIDYDAGHGVGTGRAQQNAEDADTIAFLKQQLKGAD